MEEREERLSPLLFLPQLVAHCLSQKSKLQRSMQNMVLFHASANLKGRARDSDASAEVVKLLSCILEKDVVPEVPLPLRTFP